MENENVIDNDNENADDELPTPPTAPERRSSRRVLRSASAAAAAGVPSAPEPRRRRGEFVGIPLGSMKARDNDLVARHYR